MITTSKKTKLLKYSKILTTALLAITIISGCSLIPKKNLDTSKSTKQLSLATDVSQSQVVDGFEEVDYNLQFPVRNETVVSILKKLSDKYKIVYMLQSGNLYLKDSIYKVSTMEDLQNYIKETTHYTLNINNHTYKKNQIVKVRLVPIKRNNTEYLLQGTTTLYKALGNLIDSETNIVFNNDVKDTKISLSVRTSNVGEYIQKVCATANVWCKYDGIDVTVSTKKPFYITSPVRGKVTFSMGGASGGSSGGSGEEASGGAMAEKASQSVTYQIENMNFTELVEQLQEQFKVDMYPSANGFLMFYGTPNQHELITSYFNEFSQKEEPISVKLQLLRIDLKNQFQYGVDWQNLTNSINGYDLLAQSVTGASSIIEGGRVTMSKNGTDKGMISALNTYGNVNMVDNFYSQTLTGKLIPFSNFKLVRYFTTGTSSTETSSETTVEIQEDEVGFKGNLVVTKSDAGYIVDGMIELSSVIEYITMEIEGGEIKAPNIRGTNVRISTKLSELGDSIVVGGFRSKGIENTDKSVPLIGDLAGLEWLFSGKDNMSQNSEFIIILTLDKAKSGKIRVQSKPVEIGRNYTDKKIPFMN
jgi:Bacterial type II and III secretion system protein